MTALERFLRYATYDTQSDENSNTVPSSAKQSVFAALLVEELQELGLREARVDSFGTVYAWLPATEGRQEDAVLGLIAHMDTVPRVSGQNVKPQIMHYEGGDLMLNDTRGIVMQASDIDSRYIGTDLIVTDGTTLLGADDKAGIAEIFSAIEYLATHPKIPHGKIAVAITPDEEIGRGADHFDVTAFGASVAYTVDGGTLGELEYENFNAASAEVVIHGVNIHPGSAKNKMKHALLIGMQFIQMLPPAETPTHTEGYEGFYHLCTMQGDESEAKLSLLVRDHDRKKFEERKNTLRRIERYLNESYGAGSVVLEIEDTYYNMKEPLKEHMYLIERAAEAFRSVGVAHKNVPIRGGTDGAKLTYMGLPCPNLSTGGENFHGIYEYIPVDALETMTQVLVSLAQG